ncbi:hypothetical protein HK100_003363 [Physocladia obscura]|uniref:G-protein coupled receptors family 1 profile domain-containing protein n=1 Tax=Physocladia obscura TaxID=109957 RepID=A0AAD5XD97_9FUNG|nr:hypothetical protein HK100_003363 [Physocladia obscura]
MANNALSNLLYPLLSPSTEPEFYGWMCLSVPISLIGTILNTMVLITFLSASKELLQFRIDKIMLALNVTSLIYALFMAFVQNLIQIWYNSAWFSSFQGAGLCILVLFIFAINMILSVERYLVIRYPVHDANPYIMLSVGFTAACTSVSITIVMYTLSYRHVINLIKVAAETNPTIKSKADEMQKKILISCIIMSSGIFLCYMPELVYQIISAFASVEAWVDVMAEAFMVADSVLTPVLILYFRIEMRAVFWQLFGFGIFGQSLLRRLSENSEESWELSI